MMKALENRLPPPVVAMLTGQTMWISTKWLPVIQLDPRLRFILAGGIGLFALLVAGSAIRAFRQAATTINPVQIELATQLVTTGIFRHTRNPMYVGLTAALVSWAVWLAAPWTILGPVFFALFTHRFQIIPEERVMSAKFGQAYDDYRKRVRRWI